MKHKRTVISIIICALAAILLISGCGAKKEAETTYTGIISAMDNEISLLLKEADIDHVDNIGGVDYHVGKLNGEDVVITKAGIGKVMSSTTTRYPESCSRESPEASATIRRCWMK